eukprot:scaffold28463_cov64-Attheya_sp.AAC.2
MRGWKRPTSTTESPSLPTLSSSSVVATRRLVLSVETLCETARDKRADDVRSHAHDDYVFCEEKLKTSSAYAMTRNFSKESKGHFFHNN